MRTFTLLRVEDATGVSGTGTIAEGIQFTDGTCVIRWVTKFKSTAVYSSLDELVAIHGHEGRTRVVFTEEA